MNSILITGTNRGLGLGLVRSLVNLSNPPKFIFATCRNLDKASELQEIAKQHKNVHILQLDVNNFASFDGIVKQVEEIVVDDGLNVLFNNAGIAPRSVRLPNISADDLIKTITTNTVSPIMITKAFLPLLTRASEKQSQQPIGVNKSAIINMSSLLGSISDNGQGGMYEYRVSKTGLNAATKSMSIDLKKQNILCVSMHPGWVKTDMGGSHAPLEINETCDQIVKTIFALNESHNGGFIQYDGTALKW